MGAERGCQQHRQQAANSLHLHLCTHGPDPRWRASMTIHAVGPWALHARPSQEAVASAWSLCLQPPSPPGHLPRSRSLALLQRCPPRARAKPAAGGADGAAGSPVSRPGFTGFTAGLGESHPQLPTQAGNPTLSSLSDASQTHARPWRAGPWCWHGASAACPSGRAV